SIPSDRQCSTACQHKRPVGVAVSRAPNPRGKSRSSKKRGRAPACCDGKRQPADLCQLRRENLPRRIHGRACTFYPADIPETFLAGLSKSNREDPTLALRQWSRI